MRMQRLLMIHWKAGIVRLTSGYFTEEEATILTGLSGFELYYIS